MELQEHRDNLALLVLMVSQEIRVHRDKLAHQVL
jgi:hypothetical protein